MQTPNPVPAISDYPAVQRLYNVGKKNLRGVQFEPPRPCDDNR